MFDIEQMGAEGQFFGIRAKLHRPRRTRRYTKEFVILVSFGFQVVLRLAWVG